MPYAAKPTVTTRSIVIEGTTKTLAMEDAHWRDLEEVARANDLTVAEVVDAVEATLDDGGNLSSALRSYLAVNRLRR